MAHRCGFDLQPPLTNAAADREHCQKFLDEVIAIYRLNKILRTTSDFIEFQTDDFPRLPVKGIKFISFGSTTSGKKNDPVERYVKHLHRLAQKVFGERARFWQEGPGDEARYHWPSVILSWNVLEGVVSESMWVYGEAMLMKS